MAALQPSPRFVRAVAAERAELERHRHRLAREASELRASLARIEHGLAEIEERCGLLDRLAATEAGELPIAAPEEDDGGGSARAGDRPPAREVSTVLRGPAIRERAVATLLADGRDALHYRRWYELLIAEGVEIAGKDPLAVFLTQITRSPVVRRGARAGFYELDHHAPARLEQTVRRLQQDLAATATGTADRATIRARRTQLTAEIDRAERALDEATRALDQRSRLATAGA